MPGPGPDSKDRPAAAQRVLSRRRSLRHQIMGRGERMILGALMSLAATVVERRLRKAFGTRPGRTS